MDGPAGKSLSLDKWHGSFPVIFTMDRERSVIYLLENEEPWSFLLKFQQAPEGWKKEGSIFILIGVDHFNAACETREEGRGIPMQQGDPMKGGVGKSYGNLKQEAIYKLLQSLYFFRGDRKEESMDELIRLEKPEKYAIWLPFFKGMAKGSWFFEAVASVELVAMNYNLPGQGL